MGSPLTPTVIGSSDGWSLMAERTPLWLDGAKPTGDGKLAAQIRG
jgi:hypothetical protein